MTDRSGVATCAACGAQGLRPHMRAGGELGAQGLIPTTDQFGTALADIVRCPSCGHMQVDPMPDAAMLAQAYGSAESGDYVEEEAGQRETARRNLALIEAYAPRRGQLLDLGCWVGFLSAEAQSRGWQTLGVEPSEFASTYARERLGLDVITAELSDARLPEQAFDAIAMGDLIEHLTDPAAALARTRTLLRPRGVVWMAVPDAGSRIARAMGRRWWSVIPTHVQYFTRVSISALLRRCNYEVLTVTTTPKAFTVSYYLKRVEGYSPRLATTLVKTATRAGVAQRMWAPDFGDRMAIVARSRPV
jgi:SAM-dependent methyltransferase